MSDNKYEWVSIVCMIVRMLKPICGVWGYLSLIDRYLDSLLPPDRLLLLHVCYIAHVVAPFPVCYVCLRFYRLYVCVQRQIYFMVVVFMLTTYVLVFVCSWWLSNTFTSTVFNRNALRILFILQSVSTHSALRPPRIIGMIGAFVVTLWGCHAVVADSRSVNLTAAASDSHVSAVIRCDA